MHFSAIDVSPVFAPAKLAYNTSCTQAPHSNPHVCFTTQRVDLRFFIAVTKNYYF